jgi:hypothetical protein
MGLSLRAYARHRGVSHTAVQKALRAGRIRLEVDGTIDPAVADGAWNAAADRARPNGRRSADAARVVLRPGQLAAAEATVRGVLEHHGIAADGVLELADVRLANELLKAEVRELELRKRRAYLRSWYGIAFDEPEHPATDVAAWRAWARTASAQLARAFKLDRDVVRAGLTEQQRRASLPSAWWTGRTPTATTSMRGRHERRVVPDAGWPAGRLAAVRLLAAPLILAPRSDDEVLHGA